MIFYGYFKPTFRYEFQNKGADMFLESLARLNYLLKVSGFLNSDLESGFEIMKKKHCDVFEYSFRFKP